nr:uncharacterized protein LOC124812551 isoform X2 [Hydra vulgaris]
MSEEINYAQAIESLYEKLNTMENTINNLVNALKPSSSSSMIVPATTTAVSPNSNTVVASTFNIGSSVDNSVVKSAESTGSSVVNSVVTSTSSTARSQDTQTVVASASNIDVMCERIVGRNLCHEWYDSDTAMTVLYNGRVEKLKKAQKDIIYTISYWTREENDTEAVDYYMKKFQLVADIVSGQRGNHL